MNDLQHSIMSSPTSTSRLTHQRLSTVYQFHNAPEVAPAAGLEYDDTIYPISDKYPVSHSQNFNGSATRKRSELDPDNRPPVIIFGMKLGMFFVVLAVIVLVVIGAAVGGAVGGKNLQGDAAKVPGSTAT